MKQKLCAANFKKGAFTLISLAVTIAGTVVFAENPNFVIREDSETSPPNATMVNNRSHSTSQRRGIPRAYKRPLEADKQFNSNVGYRDEEESTENYRNYRRPRSAPPYLTGQQTYRRQSDQDQN